MVKEPDQVGTEGALLVAPAAGRVNQSFYHSNAGNMIQINHGDGWFTTYIHLQSRAVAVGDQVSQGDTIGRVGHTGPTSNGHPHLHFEMAVDADNNGSATWGFEGAERVPAWFDGVQYGTAAGQTYRNVTSRNCGGSGLPPQKVAPALLKSTGDGRATILRWTSTGSSFERDNDWVGTGSSNLDLIGDRVAAGDVNGDGRDDLVAVKQNPDGTFTIHVWRRAVEDNTSWFQSTSSYDLPTGVAGRFTLGTW